MNGHDNPSVDELLAVDREFRRHAARSDDPFLHTTRDGRRYTALYSRTAQAVQYRRDLDWVVIDLEQPGPKPRWTVGTEWRGVMKGKRVVRGREVECFHFHRKRVPRRPRRLPRYVAVFV